MNLNREDVVQSALNVQRWCDEHCQGDCDCPFRSSFVTCMLDTKIGLPYAWHLEEKLRTRGVKENKIEEQKKKAKPWECHDCRYFPCLENEDKPHRATCEHFELWWRI